MREGEALPCCYYTYYLEDLTMTITITNGVTLTASRTTCELILDDLYEPIAERLAYERELEIERQLEAALDEAVIRCLLDGTNPSADDFVSDVYKDLYGVRPRYRTREDWARIYAYRLADHLGL